MNNLKLLEYCKKHPEPFLDPYYMFVEQDKELEKYVRQTKEVKDTLIAIKKVSSKKDTKQVLEKLSEDLANALTKYATFSEFGSFINAADSSIKYVKKDKNLLREVTELYLRERKLNDIVPAEWVQALIDKSSSRKKGQAGENKLVNILTKHDYYYTETYEEFVAQAYAVSRFRKDFTLQNVRKYFGVEMGRTNQNKRLDLCIKKKNDIYFLEAKHLSNAGGGQAKQVSELIDVIRIKPSEKNHHFVSFLDGVYFNLLWTQPRAAKLGIYMDEEENSDVSEISNKLQLQARDILNALRENRGNYFLNTAGFGELFTR